MTAQTFDATIKDASLFSTDRFKGGGVTIDATAEAALNLISTTSTVAEVLQILSDCVARSHAVTATSIGGATSVQA